LLSVEEHYSGRDTQDGPVEDIANKGYEIANVPPPVLSTPANHTDDPALALAPGVDDLQAPHGSSAHDRVLSEQE
jgi:hypothetical protein